MKRKFVSLISLVLAALALLALAGCHTSSVTADVDVVIRATADGTKQTPSSYWMLYTNDQENANEQWGTCEYEGEVLGSATLGAGELAVKAGCVYLWSFESFGL